MRCAWTLPVIALLLCTGTASAGRRPGKKDKQPRPTVPTGPSSPSAQAELITVAFSVTVTPYHNNADHIPQSDEARRQACLDMQNELHAEMLLRHADGQLSYAVCGLEEGDVERNSHLQITYAVHVTAETAANRKRLSEQEKKWIKGVVESAHNDSTVRVQFKTVRNGNEKYLQGYCLKDKNLAHGNEFVVGLTDTQIQDAINEHLAKAAGWDHSAAKINKTPWKTVEKQMAFKANNMFILTAWFIAQHKLQAVVSSLNVALVVAYALSTRRYRLDDTFVTGRTGAPLDPIRSAAFFQLAIGMSASNMSIPLLVPLIETILFGAPTPPSTLSSVSGVPTTAELVAHYDLAHTRDLCASIEIREQAQNKRKGQAVVIDYMNFVESTDVASAMVAAGLEVNTLFTREQATSYQCGHNSAGWACMLRTLGHEFAQVTHEMVSAINVAEYPAAQNPRIGKDANDTSWLTGDEVIKLVNLDNPDAPGTPNTWLSGPCPLNYFYTYFAQSLSASSGDIKIMVVNTAQDRGVPSENMGGTHWFIVAWRITSQSQH